MSYIDGLVELPDYMRRPMQEWIEEGKIQGGFLMSVLENDLHLAVKRADSTNSRRLLDYIDYLLGHAPHNCWGTPRKVLAWHQIGGLNGIEEDKENDLRNR